jgi:hypothetical protein
MLNYVLPTAASIVTEPSQSIPMWQTVVGLLGLGSLIATGLSHWLSTRADRRKWINDNKKLEWRELIDELDGGLEQMIDRFRPNSAAGDDRNNPIAGIVRGNRVLTGRIFIADALKKNHTMTKWKEILEYLTASEPSHTLADFSKKVSSFRDELLRIAQKDLDL